MKDYIKIIAFVTLFLIILAALSAFFNGRFWYTSGYVADRDARYAAIELEEPGQIDVLNVGNSLCDVSLTPLELYRDYGITSYNMGRDLQTKEATCYAVKTALHKQKIKVLLWETDNLFGHMDNMAPYMEQLAEFNYYHFPVLRYHNCWENWLSGTKRDEFYKGFQIRKETMEPQYEKGHEETEPNEEDHEEAESNKKCPNKKAHETKEQLMEEREQERIEKLRAKIALNKQLTFERDQMHAFKRIYNLCRANHIKLVLYSAPSMKYYQSRRRHDALTKLAEKYGIDYIDANFDEIAIGIDWSKDSYDGGKHLNLYGSRKMTKYLGEYLSTHCALTDHRGDPEYAAWAEMEAYLKECGE